MTTKVGLLNSATANWSDHEIMIFQKDHVGDLGEGFVNTDHVLASLENAGFELMTGSVTAAGWIGSDNSSC